MKIFNQVIFIICILVANTFGAEFYLYNIVKSDDSITSNNYNNHEELWSLIYDLPGIDDSLKLYKPYKIPNIIIKNNIHLKPGKTVNLLKNSKISIDKISYFYIKKNESNGDVFLYFNLNNNNLIDKPGEYLVINFSDDMKHKNDIREVKLEKLSNHVQDSLLIEISKFLKTNNDSLTAKEYAKSIIDTMANDANLIKKQISDNYYAEYFSLTKSKLTIMQFKSAKFKKEHFTVILNDKIINILPYSVFNQIFSLAGEVYFTCEGYTPGTGATGIILYKVQNTNIIRLQSDYSFAD